MHGSGRKTFSRLCAQSLSNYAVLAFPSNSSEANYSVYLLRSSVYGGNTVDQVVVSFVCRVRVHTLY